MLLRVDFYFRCGFSRSGLDNADAYVQSREDKKTGRTIYYLKREHHEKIERWYNGKFWLYDNRIIETDEAASILKVFELAYKRYNCRLFLVDNLMTVSSCRNDRDYYQIQADFTIRLSKLAKTLGVHVLLVAHPKKGDIQGNDSISGLGTIPNAADNVFSMHRVAVSEGLSCDATIACLKNRNFGDMTAVKLDYSPRSRRFTECGQPDRHYSWAGDKWVEIPDSPDMPF